MKKIMALAAFFCWILMGCGINDKEILDTAFMPVENASYEVKISMEFLKNTEQQAYTLQSILIKNEDSYEIITNSDFPDVAGVFKSEDNGVYLLVSDNKVTSYTNAVLDNTYYLVSQDYGPVPDIPAFMEMLKNTLVRSEQTYLISEQDVSEAVECYRYQGFLPAGNELVMSMIPLPYQETVYPYMQTDDGVTYRIYVDVYVDVEAYGLIYMKVEASDMNPLVSDITLLGLNAHIIPEKTLRTVSGLSDAAVVSESEYAAMVKASEEYAFEHSAYGEIIGTVDDAFDDVSDDTQTEGVYDYSAAEDIGNKRFLDIFNTATWMDLDSYAGYKLLDLDSCYKIPSEVITDASDDEIEMLTEQYMKEQLSAAGVWELCEVLDVYFNEKTFNDILEDLKNWSALGENEKMALGYLLIYYDSYIYTSDNGTQMDIKSMSYSYGLTYEMLDAYRRKTEEIVNSIINGSNIMPSDRE